MAGMVAAWSETRPNVDDLAVTLKQDPEFMAGVRRGILAFKQGRMIPWTQVKKELGLQ